MTDRTQLTGYTQHALRLSMLVCCLQVSQFSQATEVFNQLSVATLYNDNVGLSSRGIDKTSSSLLEIGATRTYRKTLGMSDSLTYGLNIIARTYSDYPCDQAGVGLQFGYQKKLGLGFGKPIFSASWKGSRQVYEVSSRNRVDSELSISLSKPFGETLDTSLTVRKNWEIPDRSPDTFGLRRSEQGSRSDALNTESLSIEFSAEYYATTRWSFPVTITFTDGDIVTGGRYTPATSNGVKAIANDRGMGRNWFVYRYSGQAWSTRLTASRLLTNGSTLNVGISHVDARSDSDIRYDRNSLSFSWVKNW